MDLYQRLGVKRGATEAEIKKAYRSLAKQLHPDRNTDNPKAAERFGAITHAYDLLSDKDKRARYDRGEIDEDGNPKSVFGNGGFGGGAPGGGYGRSTGGPEGFPRRLRRQHRRSVRPVRRPVRRRRRGAPRTGARAQALAAEARRKRAATSPIASRCPFVDAAALSPQRVTLSGGRTIDLKLPKGVEDGARIRLAGQGQEGPGGRGDAIVTIEIAPHPFFVREGDNIRLSLPVSLKEAVLGAKVKVPTPQGVVVLTVPKGSSSGKVLRLKGRGFTAKDGTRGDQLVVLAVDLPAGDAELERFAGEWAGGGNPRAALGV